MKKSHLINILIISTFLFSAQISRAEQPYDKQAERHKPTAEAMIIDGLVYRPLGLAGTLIGTGIFIATLPFSLLGGNAGDAGKRLVIEPAKDTFTRCLGCINFHHDRYDM